METPTVETTDLMTVPDVVKAIGASRRAVYRAIERAEKAGHTVMTEVLGRRFVIKKALPTLKQFYYPYYSEAHQKAVVEWGRRGGTQKRINAEKAQKRAKR